MRVLTDTHSLVWALSDPDSLSPWARQVLAEGEVMASVVNLWELCLKAGKPDALLAEPLPWWQKYVAKLGIPILSVRVVDIIAQEALSDVHKDPFDRILVAQAMVEKVPLVTKDKLLGLYGIPVIW